MVGMSKRVGMGLFLLLAVTFLIVNRGAYKGYFQDDELDNISWTTQISPADYLKGLVTPRFAENNFRPVGHFYFREAAQLFGLNFPAYVLLLQFVHLLNVSLLWLLLRRLDAPPWAAAAACAFFAFHMALFDAVWKPMYVFDVFCTTLCVASILLFAQRRWILSFAAFWLAYKAKEIAILLPLVLACYEYWFGKRRWKPLLPFFLVSILFGVQGLFLNPNRNNDYTFHFTAVALAQTSVYYAGRVLLVPYLGFVFPAAALWWARNRRVWFGLAMLALFLAPLLFLPGRLFSAYCYLPFTGLAVAFAGLAEAVGPIPLAAFFLLWLPLDYTALRAQRRATLARDDLAREWVTTLAKYSATNPRVDTIVYSGAPEGFAKWGVEGAIRFLFRADQPQIYAAEQPAARQSFQSGRVALLTWDAPARQAAIVTHTPELQDASYVTINAATPIWQLDEGWYERERDYRWIAPFAKGHLWRPAGTRQFALRVNVGPELLQKSGPVTVSLVVDGQELAPRQFAVKGWQEARWNVPERPPGPVTVTFRASPGYKAPDSRQLGVAVGGFGFR
ncbi:MAG: hypothetical protein C5B51_12805 [Terriglobia bacterium]|nr:MAG: hypothetical protein C5B51_12805 [Terriglobia bacterium]